MAQALRDNKDHIGRSRRLTGGGLGRGVTRRYVRSQLEEIDIQIEMLLHVQMHESWRILERVAWVQPAAAEIVWANRLELFYLHAVREALVETLNHL